MFVLLSVGVLSRSEVEGAVGLIVPVDACRAGLEVDLVEVEEVVREGEREGDVCEFAGLSAGSPASSSASSSAWPA